MGWGQFNQDWITTFGTIFLNLLKLIAVPLILTSLVTGVASLSDLRKLSRIGGKTFAIYSATMVVAVAAVFIAQVLGMGLDLQAQLSIIALAVLASIGTAAVPSAGIGTLFVVRESLNIPSSGVALILGVDRILDMCRTVINITGDATVATIVAASEHQLLASSPDPEVDILEAFEDAQRGT